MGLGVFITHDLSDFFFAVRISSIGIFCSQAPLTNTQVSKVLNYLDHPLVAPYFAFFVCSWIYLRHYLNLRILYSEFNEFKTVGPYGIVWEIGQYKGPLSHYISTGLLGTLQAINLFWLFLICRVCYRFVLFNNLQDDRSDNEDGQVEVEEQVKVQDTPSIQLTTASEEVLTNGHKMNGKTTTSEIYANGGAKRS